MKYLILLIFSLLVFACSNGKRVYWCGDHACINNKEKEAYFKKTMIIEIRDLSKQNKKSKSELEIIKKQAGLEQKKEIKNEKELAKQVRLDKKRRIKEEKELTKQVRLDKKRRIKEEKELAKQVRLDKKRRIKEEKELAKQVRLEEKKIIKEEKKSYKKKILKTENVPLEKEIVINTAIARINIYSNEFKELVEKITNKNMFRPYPNINDIPN
ncbi:MAG TPA: hypothetical protein EYM70_04320 [Pelagibacteraceae bacterium]|nr:hypothetical protein [Pelagibacteraceae bacterium]